MQFALYHHVGSGNRGCEALVDSTSALIRSVFGVDTGLYSQNPQQDEESGYAHISSICRASPQAGAPLGKMDKIRLKVLQIKSDYAADLAYYAKYFRTLPLAQDVYLSIGGDTYCYGENAFMCAFNRELRRRNKTTVLWGCSLDETSFSANNAADLRSFDAIFARETGTYTLLREKGFTENVFLHPDPAFTLQTELLPLPQGLEAGRYIGVNASPLVFKYEKNTNRGVGLKAYERLIEWILKNTSDGVLLIPHVFWRYSDDRDVLRPLYEKFRASGRVVLLDQTYSARELKGFISRSRAFIGARTHSTIAAYSSGVPTLVLGYSVKSVNIALDLFGRTDGFVVPVSELEEENGLCRAFDRLLQTEQLHRALLAERLPEYVGNASDAASHLRDFLEKR